MWSRVDSAQASSASGPRKEEVEEEGQMEREEEKEAEPDRMMGGVQLCM